MFKPEAAAEAGCGGIAIVGGGCSGVLVAVQLLKNGYRGRVTIIEPRSKLGRGLAYSTPFDEHLLNVPAGKMSALPQAPDHFLRWLQANGWPEATPSSFAPRKVYGEYLDSLLQAEIRGGAGRNLRQFRAEAVDVGVDGGGVRLTLSDH